MRYLLTTILILVLNVGISQTVDSTSTDLDNQIVYHSGFTLSYNESCEQANWVHYMVTKIDLDQVVARRKDHFIEDSLITTGSAKSSDYYKSGYDRGHLAPSASFIHDQSLNDETFMMSNISPQHPSFNRGMWKKLEAHERSLASSLDTIYVITGPFLQDSLETIGDNCVCIPLKYFKIFMDKSFNILDCYIMENKKLIGDIDEYKADPVLVDEIYSKVYYQLFLSESPK
jgi:endonuclease G